MLDTYTLTKYGKVLCPKCKKYGFLTVRWVRSSRYPKFGSLTCMRLEEEQEKLAKNPSNKDAEASVNYFRYYVRGNKYRGDEAVVDKRSAYRVSSGRYYHYYVGHYDSAKYRQEMVDYTNKKRKSRPNGRRWCKLPNQAKRERQNVS